MRLFRKRYRLRHPLWFALTARTADLLRPHIEAEFRSGNSRLRLIDTLYNCKQSVAEAILRVADAFASMNGARYSIRGTSVAEAGTGLIYAGAVILNPPVVSDLRYADRLCFRSLVSLAFGRPCNHHGGNRPVMVVRHVWEANHYHLVNDLIAQFRLLSADTRWPEVEVLVSPVAWSNPLFSLFCRVSPLMRGVHVRPQMRNERVTGLTFARVPHADVANFDFLLDQLPPRCVNGSGRDRRLFVSRRLTSGRCITNVNVLEAELRSRGFETIYPDEMPIELQIDLFAAASMVVGIHGAALTNIIFRRGGRLSLVEIFPPTLVASHYASICAEYRFGYNAIMGIATFASTRMGPLRRDQTYANFSVDMLDVLRAVDVMIERA